jgi:predicted DNA-binding transcriptional regulator AlpA
MANLLPIEVKSARETQKVSEERNRRRKNSTPPGLLRREAAARYCGGVGVSTWDRWTAAGLTPASVKLGGAVLWCRAELAEWCRHGCPPRAEWQPIWDALLHTRQTNRGR